MFKLSKHIIPPDMTGEELQAFLSNNGIPQGEFAKMIGYSKVQVSKWVNHYFDRKIPRAVAISCRWLLGQVHDVQKQIAKERKQP